MFLTLYTFKLSHYGRAIFQGWVEGTKMKKEKMFTSIRPLLLLPTGYLKFCFYIKSVPKNLTE